MSIETIKEYFQHPLMSEVYFQNTVGDYLAAIAIFIGLGIVFKIIQWVILRKLAKLAEKTETDIDDTIIKIVKSLRPGFYLFIAFFFAVQALTVNALGAKVVNIILLSWIILQVIVAIQILIDYVILKKFADEDGDGEPDEGIVSFMSGLAKAVLWIIGILMILSNIGVDVTGLMAGLGIGGLAIAFALQNVFADLFAAFTIYIDKPFKVGDFVVIGADKGTVQKIGIKSTRIKALQGEEIVISNKELTSARLNNFKKLQERRISTQFGVTYDTSDEMMKKIPGMVKKIVDEEKKVRFDRVHFSTFGDSALLFDLVYFMESDNYTDYMDAQQNMNLKIKTAFEGAGISMAFPTQTIHLEKG